MSADQPPPPSTALARLPSPDDVRALVRQAENGNGHCLPQLRQVLAQHPNLRRNYDLAADLRRALVAKLLPNQLYSRELLQGQVNDLLASVLGPDPTPIERLLAERVAIGWLQVQDADCRVSLMDHPPTALDLRRADAAYRRYLAALRALAMCRKLPRPAVQVNVGEQQLNVSG